MSADKQQPVTVHINIPDGNANGIWIVDRDLEWNGSVIVCPRACFETARSMKQFNQPGFTFYTIRRMLKILCQKST